MTENIGRQKPVTMEDLAKEAGVHSRTVADALKGSGRVAPATRERVLRIAKELNYTPNATARALATGRTGKIAVLSGPLTDHYYANAVHLLEVHLAEQDYELMLLQSQREVDDLIHATKASLVDGIIVVGLNHLAYELLRRSSLQQPCVLICSSDLGFVDRIILDIPPAVEEALQLMLSAGCQRITYVVNNRNEFAHQEDRMRTYLDAIKRVGYAPEFIDVDTSQSPEKRIENIKSALLTNGCPDGLLCQNDETAIHTYQALVSAGFKVPDDALLVGCDGLPYMEYFETPLSTIAFPMKEICEVAFRFLRNRMASPGIPSQHQTFPGRLMVRKSLLANH
jgi:DNA-binding LacI/PurR family transcriptional regulator